MDGSDKIFTLFKSRLSIINIGLEKLVEHLGAFGIDVMQVDWKPPAGGNPELLKKLKQLIK